VDTDARLQLFRVPERGMRLLLVDSSAGEGELRRQLASALVELRRRDSTEPRQRQWCRRPAWLALVLGLGTGDERERRHGGGRPRPLLKRSRRGEATVGVLAWGLATRRRGWGGAPARPVGGGGRQRPAAGGRAGGRRASTRGREGLGALMGGTPAQCRSVVKTG
jgi:hypothetical protein